MTKSSLAGLGRRNPTNPLCGPAAGYQPIVELGRGGMGATYLARSTAAAPGRLAVIKRPHRALLRDPDVHRRFHHEAAIASLVRHPHLMRTFGVGEDGDGPYLLLEYVHGTTLEDLADRSILRSRRPDLCAVVLIGVQCLSALEALHDARDSDGVPLRIIHRDVSPQNILVSARGDVRLGDFGVAKSRLQEARTDQQTLLGKLQYLPVEYLKERRVGPRLDSYATAMTLWTTLAGRPPFVARNERSFVGQVLRGRVPALRSVWPECPPEIDQLLTAATHPDWRERLSPRELRAGLARWLEPRVEEGSIQRFVEGLAGADLRTRAAAWGIEDALRAMERSFERSMEQSAPPASWSDDEPHTADRSLEA